MSGMSDNKRLERVARNLVLDSPGTGIADAKIGSAYPKERVVRRLSEQRLFGKRDEFITVTFTTMPGGIEFTARRKERRTRWGRILLSHDRVAREAFGGLMWVERQGRRCVHAVYIVPAYQRFGLGHWLAELSKVVKAGCVFAPVSADGRAWATREALPIL